MLRSLRLGTHFSPRTFSHFALLSSRSAHVSTSTAPIEEQTLPRYCEKHFYPAKIGEVINERYRIIAKLGYGSHSTVWLANDQATGQYAALKICIQASASSPVTKELRVLQHLKNFVNDHPGVQGTRLLKDNFQIDGHECFVMAPQACSLQQLRQLYGNQPLPLLVLTLMTMPLLASVNWLHVDCGIVHTDISPQNILLTAPGNAIFQRIEREESENPSVPFMDDSRPVPHPIYESKASPISSDEAWSGVSVLNDLGCARFLQVGETTQGWCMPDTYRAPEILMQVPWDHMVDVWSIAIMLLELVENRNLFKPFDLERRQYVVPLAVAQYVGYLGLPPLQMIQRSEDPHIRNLFDAEGQWKAEIPVPATSLEVFVTVIPPGKEKDQFLAFIRRMLTWEASTRAPLTYLLEDEWLQSAFPE